MTSFGREYELIFQGEDGSSVKIGQTFDQVGLKIDFNISKSATAGSNVATIGVWNVSKNTIGILQKKGIIRLKLGYKGDISTVLVGSKQSINYDDTDDGDKRVEIKVMEGIGNSFAKMQFSKQYGLGATNGLIIQDLVAFIVGTTPSIDRFNFYTIDKIIFYSNPQTVVGNALKKLTEFLTPAGYKYFINKGELSIISSNGFIKDLSVPMSTKTGLLGVPKPIAENDDSAKSKPGIQFRCILNYNLDVGRRITVSTADYNNSVFVIDSVVFQGDTFDGEYTCNVRAYESD